MIEILPLSLRSHNGQVKELASLNAGFLSHLGTDANLWWRRAARHLITLERYAERQPSSVNEYMEPNLKYAREVLSDLAQIGSLDGHDSYERIGDGIRRLSFSMAEEFSDNISRVPYSHLSLPEVIDRRPDMLRLQGWNGSTSLQAKDPQTQNWLDIPIPDSSQLVYVGGVARAVLMTASGADTTRLSRAIPWRDFDISCIGAQHLSQAKLWVAKHLPGTFYMEVLPEPLDPHRYFASRDIISNQVLLGRNGLIYSQGAYDAAITGHTALVTDYVPETALFGFNIQIRNGKRIVNPHGMVRLISKIVEGKSDSFDFSYFDREIPELGIYWLSMTRRWLDESNFPAYMHKAFYLGKKMGQLMHGEETIYDVLEKTHQRNPVFSFDEGGLNSEAEYILLMMEKLMKQVLREYKWNLLRLKGNSSNDTRKLRTIFVSLDGYESKPEQLEQFRQWWPGFLEQCRARRECFSNSKA